MRSARITPASIKERIPDSRLRKFVEDVASGANLHDAAAAIALLDTGAAIAPSLAAEVLGLRAPILRALNEGCPKVGRNCAWCGTDLTPANEHHQPGCPWLPIVNASSWLDGIQPALGWRVTDTERLERIRELVRILLTLPVMGRGPVRLEDWNGPLWTDAQREAYQGLCREAGVLSATPREGPQMRPRPRVPPSRPRASEQP